jgi:hypothetical protein
MICGFPILPISCPILSEAEFRLSSERIVAYSSVTLRPTDWDWRGRADRAADELDGVSVGGGFLGTLAGFAAGGDEFQEIEKN